MKDKIVEITGAWIRRRGDQVQMLLEVDGKWKLVCAEGNFDFSHIVGPSGIAKAEDDPKECKCGYEADFGHMVGCAFWGGGRDDH